MFLFPISSSIVLIKVSLMATGCQSEALDSSCSKPAATGSSREADFHISLSTLDLDAGFELALQLRSSPTM